MKSKIINWLKENFKRIWFAGLGAWGFGALITWLWSLVSDKEINGIVMLVILAGATVGGWFILANNDDFKNEIERFKK